MQRDKEAQAQFLDALPAKNLSPLWTVMDALVTHQPKPKATPAIWKYEDVRPDLIKAGRLIPEQEAERRVLMLINPSMSMQAE